MKAKHLLKNKFFYILLFLSFLLSEIFFKTILETGKHVFYIIQRLILPLILTILIIFVCEIRNKYLEK